VRSETVFHVLHDGETTYKGGSKKKTSPFGCVERILHNSTPFLRHALDGMLRDHAAKQFSRQKSSNDGFSEGVRKDAFGFSGNNSFVGFEPFAWHPSYFAGNEVGLGTNK